MEPSPIRSRLAGSQGRMYWRSLGELADTLQFREYLHREFPAQASDTTPRATGAKGAAALYSVLAFCASRQE